MKKTTFWKIYRKIILILFILVFITWGALWLFLDSYEKGRPTHFAEDVVTWYEKENVNKISKYVKLNDNGFNNINYLRKSLKDKINYKDLSYIKDALKYKNSKPVYSILSDGKEVASITLKTSGKGLFGINRWEIESINPHLDLEEITIYVPDSVNVTVNGNLLDMNSLKEENVYTEDLEVFKDYTDVKGLYKYVIKDMYKKREVKVSSGSITSKGNIYTYRYDKNDELLNSLKDSLSSWCQNYTRYVLKEVYFGDIAGMVVQNSETYKLLRGVSNTNLWSGNHTPTEFGDIKFDNMEVFGDNAFKVDVHYTYSFDAEVGHQEDEANLTLYMLNENGNWKILKLNT